MDYIHLLIGSYVSKSTICTAFYRPIIVPDLMPLGSAPIILTIPFEPPASCLWTCRSTLCSSAMAATWATLQKLPYCVAGLAQPSRTAAPMRTAEAGKGNKDTTPLGTLSSIANINKSPRPCGSVPPMYIPLPTSGSVSATPQGITAENQQITRPPLSKPNASKEPMWGNAKDDSWAHFTITDTTKIAAAAIAPSPDTAAKEAACLAELHFGWQPDGWDPQLHYFAVLPSIDFHLSKIWVSKTLPTGDSATRALGESDRFHKAIFHNGLREQGSASNSNCNLCCSSVTGMGDEGRCRLHG